MSAVGSPVTSLSDFFYSSRDNVEGFNQYMSTVTVEVFNKEYKQIQERTRRSNATFYDNLTQNLLSMSNLSIVAKLKFEIAYREGELAAIDFEQAKIRYAWDKKSNLDIALARINCFRELDGLRPKEDAAKEALKQAKLNLENFLNRA